MKFKLCLILLATIWQELAVSAPTTIVAAASSVKFAIEEIAQEFNAETGLEVQFSFGSSANLTRQIIQQAPFELFISADEAYVLRLWHQGLTPNQGVVYAKGKLALFIPHNSPLNTPETTNNVQNILHSKQIQHLAIANPELAPYGKMAKEFLVTTNLWQTLKHKLVLGENVAQAAQFAISGATEVGIIAYAYSFNPKLQKKGKFLKLSSENYQPLLARMVLVNNASSTANKFYQYLQQDTAKKIFVRHGFQ